VSVDLLIIPRWGGTADHDFYPWLRGRLGEVVRVDHVVLANPPTIDEALEVMVPRLERADARTIVLGHSVGVQAAMRALAAARRPTPLAALIAVAGWFTVDRPWPTIVPWIETPFDHVAMRAAVRELRVLLSDDDLFTADFRATRARFEQLGATVELEPGAKHFNAVEEPAVERVVRAVLAA